MAHTLTLIDTHKQFTLLVNEIQVPLPYTLQNGDIITIDSEGMSIQINNGTSYNDSATIDLSDIDIHIDSGTLRPVPFSFRVTINYTETQPQPTTTQNIKIGTSNVDIKIGETQVDKVYVGETLVWEKEEPESQGETWVINDTISGEFDIIQINFISNNNEYNAMSLDALGLIYKQGQASLIAYDSIAEEWRDQAYRTITFETAPTGDLLTWLQANAVKQ